MVEHDTIYTICLPACLPAVNVPGTYIQYDASGTPSAVTCPQDTYSPGFRKQRACVACPSGFSTRGNNGSTSSSACGEAHHTLLVTAHHQSMPEAPSVHVR